MLEGSPELFQTIEGALEKHECYQFGIWTFFCIENIFSSMPPSDSKNDWSLICYCYPVASLPTR